MVSVNKRIMLCCIQCLFEVLLIPPSHFWQPKAIKMGCETLAMSLNSKDFKMYFFFLELHSFV